MGYFAVAQDKTPLGPVRAQRLPSDSRNALLISSPFGLLWRLRGWKSTTNKMTWEAMEDVLFVLVEAMIRKCRGRALTGPANIKIKILRYRLGRHAI